VALSLLEDFQKLGGDFVTQFDVKWIRVAEHFDDDMNSGSKSGNQGDIVKIRIFEDVFSTSASRPNIGHVHRIVKARHVIVCGGINADKIAYEASGGEPNPRIVPFRGTWLTLKSNPSESPLVKTNVYPVPNPSFPFLGLHFTPTIEPENSALGKILIGPNASLAFHREVYFPTFNFVLLLRVTSGTISTLKQHSLISQILA